MSSMFYKSSNNNDKEKTNELKKIQSSEVCNITLVEER